MEEKIIASREYRELLLADPYRPTYHFAVPDDLGFPGDPNGAFYADGVYHLMYLYKNSRDDQFCWGHISSVDLLHWRHHPDALAGNPEQVGFFSGGGFVDEDKTAYISYWKIPGEKVPWETPVGVAIARSKPPYDRWEELEPLAVKATVNGITDMVIDGETVHLGCADPSNIWKSNGYYYMQMGNKVVLDSYGRGEDAPEKYKGDWTDLFRSKDLYHWEYVHRFYQNTHAGEDWPDATEDDMCPSFLPLYDAKSGGNPTGKWLQLFISHNKGCQYYIGKLEGETFIPEQHGRMSWNDNTFFAPEALVDDKNRHILWAWMRDNPHDNAKEDYEKYGWSGAYSFPRVVWLKDNVLHMAPAEELDRLQYNHQSFNTLTDAVVPVKNGECFRLKAEWNLSGGCENKVGFRLRVSEDGNEYTEIYLDKAANVLVFDASHSGNLGCPIKEVAPFSLADGENLSLDIFVDKSFVEVYANERQAICRRVYPTDPAHSMSVMLVGNKAPETLDAWEMAPANMY